MIQRRNRVKNKRGAKKRTDRDLDEIITRMSDSSLGLANAREIRQGIEDETHTYYSLSYVDKLRYRLGILFFILPRFAIM